MADLLKVIIVDDEYLVRNLLRNCIDWEEIGYEIIGEASSAKEALELVDRLKPDVIFTDICMPYMDGIEFGKFVFDKNPSIKIIVLTGYEEFEYAKRSIKIGIADFLLKPINDDEIRKAAINMKERIQSERNQSDEYRRAKKQLEENLPYLREKLLNEVLHNSFEYEDIRERLEYFKIKINLDNFQIAVIDAFFSELDKDISEEDKLLLKMQCFDLVSGYFRDNEYVIVFMDESQKVLVLNSDKGAELTKCLEDIRDLLIIKLKCFISIGVGSIYNHISKIKDSYKEAHNAVNYKIIAGNNQVIYYSDISFLNSEQYKLDIDNLDSLAFYIKAGMGKKAREFIDTAFKQWGYNGKVLKIDSIRASSSNIVSVILTVITEVGINISEVFGGGFQPFDRVFIIDTLPDMKQYILELIDSTTVLIQNMQNKKVNQLIQQVKEYIHDNLTDSELSLSNTAKVFYINMSYLSRIFKQDTGLTFIEYLTKARMEKSIKLLNETDMKAYQIAESVGIVDPHYFGICFKKYTGISINDFKKVK